MNSRFENMNEIDIIVVSAIAKCMDIPIEKVKKGSKLVKDLSVSSFDILNIVCDLEDILNIDVDIDKAEGVETVEDFIEVFRESVNLG
jgi:acyl carrier protein